MMLPYDDWTDEMLREEFQKAVEYKLEQLPSDDKIHHIFSLKHRQAMKKILHPKVKEPISLINLGWRASAKLAAVAIVLSSLMLTVTAAQKVFFHFTQQKFSDRSEISFTQDGEIHLPKKLIKYMPDIPEEYVLEAEYESPESYTAIYRNSQGKRIDYLQARLDVAGVIIDTETHDFEEVMLSDGTIAHYLPNDVIFTIMWENSIYSFMLTVDSDKIDIIKLAESTKLVEK